MWERTLKRAAAVAGPLGYDNCYSYTGSHNSKGRKWYETVYSSCEDYDIYVHIDEHFDSSSLLFW